MAGRSGTGLDGNEPICVSLFREFGYVVCGVRQRQCSGACPALSDFHARCLLLVCSKGGIFGCTLTIQAVRNPLMNNEVEEDNAFVRMLKERFVAENSLARQTGISDYQPVQRSACLEDINTGVRPRETI